MEKLRYFRNCSHFQGVKISLSYTVLYKITLNHVCYSQKMYPKHLAFRFYMTKGSCAYFKQLWKFWHTVKHLIVHCSALVGFEGYAALKKKDSSTKKRRPQMKATVQRLLGHQSNVAVFGMSFSSYPANNVRIMIRLFKL